MGKMLLLGCVFRRVRGVGGDSQRNRMPFLNGSNTNCVQLRELSLAMRNLANGVFLPKGLSA